VNALLRRRAAKLLVLGRDERVSLCSLLFDSLEPFPIVRHGLLEEFAERSGYGLPRVAIVPEKIAEFDIATDAGNYVGEVAVSIRPVRPGEGAGYAKVFAEEIRVRRENRTTRRIFFLFLFLAAAVLSFRKYQATGSLW